MQTNRYIHPVPGIIGACANRLANSPLLLACRRAIMSRLPFLRLASDVRDVVYCNWVVDVAAVAHLVPQGVKLWQRDGKTIFTILTYTHGHFGPAFAGPLRKLFPSPLQSNWRLYLDGPGDEATVLFVKNILDSAVHAVGTRVFSDALPSHYATAFTHRCQDGRYDTRIDPGQGSAPAFECSAQATGTRALPPDFAALFHSWDESIAFLSLQHAAIAYAEDVDRLAYARIELPVDLAAVQPLQARAASPFLDVIGARAAPFSFAVPAVAFRVLSERML
ncbi:DUF2071 domain-containing protein [Pseudoduganella violacea]|uniref:DUF2071 domain-containing protein n=1 Tax=Pseudoduganella violacea TaxID=1715466 RepID=A0A7W5BCI3_9BURK|nr:DUF2071 domain-containing protein [Pseudoduganella violacea]MBB3120601.1 hypothetical protein [Pseudoduganella violacea]